MFITRLRRSDRYFWSVMLIAITLVFSSLAPSIRSPIAPVPNAAQQSSEPQQWQRLFEQLPISFEANNGQFDQVVKFSGRLADYQVQLTATGAKFAFHQSNNSSSDTSLPVQMEFVGAQTEARAEGVNPLATRSNYLLGADQRHWHANIEHYQQVRYRDLYPGIDLVYYGNQQKLEYDLIVSPGVDPGQIRVKFDLPESFAANNRPMLWLDAAGDLVAQMANGQLRKHRPVIYQEIEGARRYISGNYLLSGGNEVALEFGAYDQSQPLIIDPMLSYASFLGGRDTEQATAVAVDSAGNIYLAGSTSSSSFPLAAPFQSGYKGVFDIFIAKLNPQGNSLIYATYLGGSSVEQCFGLAVDAAGNAYLTGVTNSADFPTANPLQAGKNGRSDLFISKLSADGKSLIYSTYLGGDDDDEGLGIAVNAAGSAFVTGTTSSVNFPVNQGTRPGGDSDAFVARLSNDGKSLVYATYLGGNDEDEGLAIAVDANNNAYITGDTFSVNFPTVNALQTNLAGNQDAFITKLDPQGRQIIFSSYLGGSANEEGLAIALDKQNNVYLAGSTFSTNFPTSNPLQPPGGAKDAFITRLNTAGDKLLFSSYFGGSGDDVANAIALDDQGNIFFTGGSFSTNLPTSRPLQAKNNGSSDAYLAKLTAGGSLSYASYFGGKAQDESFALALDKDGQAIIAGVSASSDLATLSPFQPKLAGGADAFIARIVDQDTPMTGDFQLTITPTSQTVIVGNSTVFDISARSINNFVGPITLSVALSPNLSNITTNFSSPTIIPGGNSTLMISVGNVPAPQAIDVAITGTAGQLVRTISVQLMVVTVPSTADFSIAVNPAQLTVSRGQTRQIEILINRVGDFQLSVNVTPQTIQGSKIVITPPVSSTTGNSLKFDLKVKRRARKGTQKIAFVASDGALTRQAELTLTVQ